MTANKEKPPLAGQRWHKRRELTDASFGIGEQSELALQNYNGWSWWYWTPNQKTFYGPFRSKKRATDHRELYLEPMR